MKIKNIISKLLRLPKDIAVIYSKLDMIQISIGRVEQKLDRDYYNSHDRLTSYEFKVYSQWGEDGIIQYLTNKISIDTKSFIEFGVESYIESNTRFLLQNNNWSGLVIDGSKDNIDYIKKDSIYWKHNLKAVCDFINKDNINDIIRNSGMSGDVGLLSIDLDGNDYWIWQSIDIVRPAIVVIEYNSRFGKERAITIPYDSMFVRSQAHHSNIYFGASLKALVKLGQQKGYAFVGCNSSGLNAFFVRYDLKPEKIKELSIDEGYVESQFRECRDLDGNLLYISREEELEILKSLPVVEV